MPLAGTQDNQPAPKGATENKMLISTKEYQYLLKALGEHNLAKLMSRSLTKEELQQVLYC